MDNVCRRVNLQQPDLFGLKFFSRRPYPKDRWVDLDRPLKKQLDKYAQQPTGPLRLGVMFYVHDVSLLEDEVTRFHYFMQLKYDVLDGKLRYVVVVVCSPCCCCNKSSSLFRAEIETYLVG